MSAATAAFTAIVFLLLFAPTLYITWFSLRKDRHSPSAKSESAS